MMSLLQVHVFGPSAKMRRRQHLWSYIFPFKSFQTLNYFLVNFQGEILPTSVDGVLSWNFRSYEVSQVVRLSLKPGNVCIDHRLPFGN